MLTDREQRNMKIIAGVALGINLILTAIQIVGVYKESFCIVTLMAIFMLVVLILWVVQVVSTKGKDSASLSSMVGSVIWFVLCAGYAFMIWQSRQDDRVRPFAEDG